MIPSGTILMYQGKPYIVPVDARVGGVFYRSNKIWLEDPETGKRLQVSPDDLEVVSFDGVTMPEDQAARLKLGHDLYAKLHSQIAATTTLIDDLHALEQEQRLTLQARMADITAHAAENQQVVSLMKPVINDKRFLGGGYGGDSQFTVQAGLNLLVTLRDSESRAILSDNMARKGFSPVFIAGYFATLDQLEQNQDRIKDKAYLMHYLPASEEEQGMVNAIYELAINANAALSLDGQTYTPEDNEYLLSRLSNNQENIKTYSEIYQPKPHQYSRQNVSPESLQLLHDLSEVYREGIAITGTPDLIPATQARQFELLQTIARSPQIQADLAQGAQLQEYNAFGPSYYETIKKSIDLLAADPEAAKKAKEINLAASILLRAADELLSDEITVKNMGDTQGYYYSSQLHSAEIAYDILDGAINPEHHTPYSGPAEYLVETINQAVESVWERIMTWFLRLFAAPSF
jgi:hypothetical protein